MNDVISLSKYYHGKEEPPPFHREYFDVSNKQFVPIDNFRLASKISNAKQDDVIFHYFVYDSKQNKLMQDSFAHTHLHKKVYAVTSPDFSVDSTNCFSCFNISNILKSRICAYRWQSEKGQRVILTLIWGNEDTYSMAFGNIDKGSIVAVSSQGIADFDLFEKGIRCGIDTIQPSYICWYGKVPNFITKYYDTEKIISMQSRGTIFRKVNQKEKCLRENKNNLTFNF